tara:strand:+ start:1073 stop:2458 length:1386 start_codon:yes stop_codon:yes gene_type:complete
MALVIQQNPLYEILPVGQQVIFAVSDNTVVGSNFKVKFIAEVYVSTTAISFSSNELAGSFKTTPNNAGVGIFDFQSVLETFVKPDNEASSQANSTYKGIPSSIASFPIHLVDEYSLSDNSIKYFAVKFRVEYFTTATTSTITISGGVNSDEYTIFNGTLQYDDVLTKSLQGNYGYDLDEFYLDDSSAKFLSNAPATQYARLEDYGTLPFLNFAPTSSDNVDWITVNYYNAAGGGLGSDNVLNQTSTGGANSVGNSDTRLNYFGGFPANLQNWSATFAAAVVNATPLSYYTIQAKNPSISALYTIKILCENTKGFEAIRLAWLNQWGAWDYYTFNMKSVKSIKTNRTSYTQLGGTWNESLFKISDYKGGKKNFRVNSTEKVKLNTDFVSEAEGVWFEELINSNEVYIVNGFSTDVSNTITRKYIEPVVLTTSSYVKKTIANDKLMQYTIEIEKSKMKRTHSA